MSALDDFKRQNPAYADVPDETLANALHKKYYSSVPYGEFAVKVGLKGPDPTEGMSTAEKFLAGAGKAMTDVYRGARQIFMGDNQQQIDESRRLDAPLMKTKAGMAGNIAGNIGTMAGTALIPGANTVSGSAVVGSVLGGLSPVATGESRLDNTVMGGVGGAAGGAIAKGLSRVISPNTAPEVKALMNEGVTPTIGQTLGGFANAVENKLTSVPLVGDAINAGRRRATEQFNQAAYNRALSPIGQKASGKVGRQGVENVSDALSAAYEDLLPRLTFKADQTFTNELNAVRSMAATLPDTQAKRFEKLLTTQLLDRMTPAGTMSGETLKAAESQLGKFSRGYSKDQSFDNQQLADALKEVQAIVRGAVTRSNPDGAAELAAINKGYANYDRIRRAASMQGADNGVFSPRQLSSAVRSQDSTVAKGAYAKGNALMQDLTDAGRTVLGNSVPDSGTAGRLLMSGGLGGLGTYIAGGTIPALGPTGWGILGMSAAGSLPYTAMGQKIIAGLLAKRPDIAGPIGNVVGGYSPELGLIGSSYALQK